MKRLKCKVMPLPTEKAINGKTIQVQVSNGYLMGITTNVDYTAKNLIKPQHLYFTSNREIKYGDYVYCTLVKDIFMCQATITGSMKKVEATTDPSLGLPLIPQSFVEKYVQLQGDIDEVEIEMILEHDLRGGQPEFQYVPKTRPDNTVIVHKVKDMWTREEVEKLCRTALSDGTLFCMPNFRGKVLTSDEWIEENL